MIKPYPGPKTDPIGRHHAEVAATEILDGYLLNVTFTSSSTATVPHALGRAYRGVIQIASSQPNIMVCALLPSTASGAGTDTKKNLPLTATSSWTGTVTLWVF